VLIPSPNYSSHIEQVLFAEGIPVFVSLREENGWMFDVEAFRRAITPKTKALILCNPMNPTGAYFDREQLQAVVDLVREHDLFLIADEAYDFLTYDGLDHVSTASFPEIKDKLIAVYSFSKKFCMTGWRVGFMYANSRIIQQVLKVHDAFAICAPTISQYAALAALRETNGVDGKGDAAIKNVLTTLQQRRDLLCSYLDELPDLFSYQKPRGAYYVFPKIENGMQSMELALALLNEAHVITIPGNGFGPTGEGHIRMSFGGSETVITNAFGQIKAWWEKKRKIGYPRKAGHQMTSGR
jgi:aminotransferase